MGRLAGNVRRSPVIVRRLAPHREPGQVRAIDRDHQGAAYLGMRVSLKRPAMDRACRFRRVTGRHGRRRMQDPLPSQIPPTRSVQMDTNAYERCATYGDTRGTPLQARWWAMPPSGPDRRTWRGGLPRKPRRAALICAPRLNPPMAERVLLAVSDSGRTNPVPGEAADLPVSAG